MYRIILYLLAGLLTSCNAQSPTDGTPAAKRVTTRPTVPKESPVIRIQVQGAPQGQAYLIGMSEGQNYRIDSTQIGPDGTMLFQRQEPYPSGLVIAAMPNNEYVQFLIDTDQTFTLRTRMGNLVGAMQVEGSEDNQLYYQNVQYETNWQNQTQQLSRTSPTFRQDVQRLSAERQQHLEDLFRQSPQSFFTSFKRAGQNPEVKDIRLPDGSPDKVSQVTQYRRDMWSNVDFSDERLLYTPVIPNKMKKYMTELTVQQPDSIKRSADFLMSQVLDYPAYYRYFANWIALNYEPTKTTLMDPEAVYVHMVQNYFTSDRAFWSDSAEVFSLQLRAKEMAASLVGLPAPNVTANDPNGTPRTLLNLKAPYLIVYLFNPTCEHCMEQTPKLVQFYQQYRNQGVDIYSIAIDTTPEEWKEYIAKTGMTWTNVYDATNRSIYGKYYVDITPEIYVINPERKIIAKNLKVNQIAEVIQRDQAK